MSHFFKKDGVVAIKRRELWLARHARVELGEEEESEGHEQRAQRIVYGTWIKCYIFQ